MKSWFHPLTAALLVIALSSACAQKPVREEPYTPSNETLHLKSDSMIVELWDRWDESSSSALVVNENHVVSWSEIPRLLADDPSHEVVSKIQTYERWNKIAIISGLVGLSAGVLALLGSVPDQDHPRWMSVPVANTLWGVSALGFVTAGVAWKISYNALRSAVPLHNEGVRARTGSVALNWEARF